jgi:hypothetical protein
MNITEREKSPQQWPRIMPQFCEPSQIAAQGEEQRKGEGEEVFYGIKGRIIR